MLRPICFWNRILNSEICFHLTWSRSTEFQGPNFPKEQCHFDLCFKHRGIKKNLSFYHQNCKWVWLVVLIQVYLHSFPNINHWFCIWIVEWRRIVYSFITLNFHFWITWKFTSKKQLFSTIFLYNFSWSDLYFKGSSLIDLIKLE